MATNLAGARAIFQLLLHLVGQVFVSVQGPASLANCLRQTLSLGLERAIVRNGKPDGDHQQHREDAHEEFQRALAFGRLLFLREIVE